MQLVSSLRLYTILLLRCRGTSWDFRSWSWTVFLFWATYWSSHPENYLFSSLKTLFWVKTSEKKKLLTFEKRSCSLEAKHKCCAHVFHPRQSVLPLSMVLSELNVFLIWVDFFVVRPPSVDNRGSDDACIYSREPFPKVMYNVFF